MELGNVIDNLQEAAAYFRSSFDAMYGTFACEKFMAWTNAIELAAALLKAQEPRLMTLEEAQKSQMIEYRSGNTRDVGAEMYSQFEEYYNKVWRVWTSRPTAEQMEAEPWT